MIRDSDPAVFPFTLCQQLRVKGSRADRRFIPLSCVMVYFPLPPRHAKLLLREPHLLDWIQVICRRDLCSDLESVYYISSSSTTGAVITLYDSPGTRSQTWMPTVWRIRFILNYKRLPYRTVWVEIPEVEATLRAIGAPPSSHRPDGRPIYTLPVIVDPSRNPQTPNILSNATNIAEYLEACYPQRPVFPEGSRALQTLFVHYIQEVFAKPLLPIMVPLSHDRLPARTQSHFHDTSLARSRTPMPMTPSSSQALPPGPQREHAWQLVKEQFDFLSLILDKNVGDGDGVVAQGKHVSYADFALCSVLLWIEQMAPQDGWARVREWNGGRWTRLRQRCQDYMDVF